MAESQQEVDALLAEVNALADEAVADIVGDGLAADTPLSPPAGGQPGEPGAAAGSAFSGMGGASIDQSAFPDPAAAGGHPQHLRVGDPARVLSLEVPVIVRLAERTMPLASIIALTTGAIIEFEKPADSELDLMINNKCIGQGQAVKVGENFGLRVSQIGSLQSRIKAMGGQ